MGKRIKLKKGFIEKLLVVNIFLIKLIQISINKNFSTKFLSFCSSKNSSNSKKLKILLTLQL